MILTVNVSNSNILIGAYQNNDLLFCARLHTSLLKTTDEYAAQLHSILSLYGYHATDITGAILSCVVPSLLSCIRNALKRVCLGRIYLVGPGLKTGLSIRTDDPSQLGSDLVCCAVAVLNDYSVPAVIISLDTAISMTALDQTGAMRGGAIMPGVRTGLDALGARTAQLPQIDLVAPACGVLGTNSTASLQAGAIFGTASLLDGMIARFSKALGEPITYIATGECAPEILPHCNHQIVYHENLVLRGLYLLYQKNAK